MFSFAINFFTSHISHASQFLIRTPVYTAKRSDTKICPRTLLVRILIFSAVKILSGLCSDPTFSARFCPDLCSNPPKNAGNSGKSQKKSAHPDPRRSVHSTQGACVQAAVTTREGALLSLVAFVWCTQWQHQGYVLIGSVAANPI